MENTHEIIESYPSAYHYNWKRMRNGAVLASLSAALLMAAYFAIVKSIVPTVSPLAHYIQYIILFGIINVFLISQKHNTGYNEAFVTKAFIGGGIVSCATGVVFFILEMGILQVFPGGTMFNTTGREYELGTSPPAILAAMGMEIFVFGMLSTFVAFQYLKRPHAISKTEQ